MSYFGTIYADTELPSRARAVYMYLRDRADSEGKCWPGIKTIASDMRLSRSTVKRALTDLEQHGYLQKTRAIVITAAVHPICIPCSRAAERRSPPPREDCAYLLDPGEVHDGPPRRTHSTGDLIQRKNSGIVAEYRIYFNIEMGQAASVYTCYLPCRNRYFFFMDRSSIYPRLPRGSN